MPASRALTFERGVTIGDVLRRRGGVPVAGGLGAFAMSMLISSSVSSPSELLSRSARRALIFDRGVNTGDALRDFEGVPGGEFTSENIAEEAMMTYEIQAGLSCLWWGGIEGAEDWVRLKEGRLEVEIIKTDAFSRVNAPRGTLRVGCVALTKYWIM